MAGQRAREGGFGDAGDRHAEGEGGLHGPGSGALGAGLVEDDIDEGLSGVGVDLTEHLGGDLYEVRLQFAAVPFREDIGDLGGGLAGAASDEVVGLGDQLHVGVLDAVVHHLHEVAGAVVSDVRDAGLALGDRGDRGQDRPQGDPRLVGAAGHDRGSEECALLAAGHAHPNEVDAGLAYGLLATDGVGEQRVAAVDDDVAGFEDLDERLDHRVGRPSGLDHDDRRTRLLQRRGELLVGERGDEAGFGVLGDELVGLGPRAVVHRHRVSFAAGEVAGQIRAHHRQTDHADVR